MSDEGWERKERRREGDKRECEEDTQSSPPDLSGSLKEEEDWRVLEGGDERKRRR